MSFNKEKNLSELTDWALSEEIIEDYNSFYEPVIFSLDENYLEEVINDQCEDADEASRISECSKDSSGSEINMVDLDIVIKQEDAKSLTCCVIVDRLDRCIKRCVNSESFQKLWQLCRVWQVDGDGISKADGILEQLGICSYHFNHD